MTSILSREAINISDYNEILPNGNRFCNDLLFVLARYAKIVLTNNFIKPYVITDYLIV